MTKSDVNRILGMGVAELKIVRVQGPTGMSFKIREFMTI